MQWASIRTKSPDSYSVFRTEGHRIIWPNGRLFYCSFSWRIQISHLQQHLRTTVHHHNNFLVYIIIYIYIYIYIYISHTHTHLLIYVYTSVPLIFILSLLILLYMYVYNIMCVCVWSHLNFVLYFFMHGKS